MNWTAWAVNIAFLGMPTLSCVWGWWLWKHRTRKQLAEWRQTATMIGLVVMTLSVVTGAFAMVYWQQFPGNGAPPEATRIATLAGFGFGVFSLPFSVLARAWTRVALVLCGMGLMGFYFGMFAAP